MKLLFERFSPQSDWQLRDAVQQSVAQLAASQGLIAEDVPPGILNFGVPHPVDFSASEAGRLRFGEALAERIRQFEPRLELLDLQVEGQQLKLIGRLKDSDELLQWSVTP